MWVGNVGEITWEEVEYVEAGKNYGWPIMEGPVCAPFGPPECDQTGLVPPVWAYTHEAAGVSITGGYVYRGEAIPALRGKYVFADFGSHRVWYLDRDNPTSAELLLPPQFNVTTFGEDPDGELYFNHFFSGRIFKVTPGPDAADSTSGPSSGRVSLSVYPDPAQGVATARFTSEAGRVQLSVYDLLGRRVATLFDAHVGPGADRTVPFDTQRLAAGMYFLRLEARGEVETEKLVVAR